ncbi:MAG: hypothetical protein KDD56_01090 [Bdellovibrionales bacterium]|nr:hypothetical protein [Bdellovibrionales bacterium]
MTEVSMPGSDPNEEARLSLQNYRENLESLTTPDFDFLFEKIVAQFGLKPIDRKINFIPPGSLLWLLPKLQQMFSKYKEALNLSGKLNPEIQTVAQAFDRAGVKFVLLEIKDGDDFIVPNKRSKLESGAPAFFEKLSSETRLLVKKPDKYEEIEFTPIFQKSAFKELMKPLLLIGKYLDSVARPEVALPADIPVASYLFEALVDELENELDRLGTASNTYLILENIKRIYVSEDKVINFVVEVGEFGPDGSTCFGAMGVKNIHLKFHAGLHSLGTLHSVCIERNFLDDRDLKDSEAA